LSYGSTNYCIELHYIYLLQVALELSEYEFVNLVHLIRTTLLYDHYHHSYPNSKRMEHKNIEVTGMYVVLLWHWYRNYLWLN